jgi:hypothetical protein
MLKAEECMISTLNFEQVESRIAPKKLLNIERQ